MVIFFSYLLSKQNKNMNNAGGYQNGFFSHILMTFCNFNVCHNKRNYYWLGQKNRSFGHIFKRPPGISHVQFIFNYYLTLMLCSKLILFLKMDQFLCLIHVEGNFLLPNLISDFSTGSNMKVLNSLLKSMYIVEINNHLK